MLNPFRYTTGEALDASSDAQNSDAGQGGSSSAVYRQRHAMRAAVDSPVVLNGTPEPVTRYGVIKNPFNITRPKGGDNKNVFQVRQNGALKHVGFSGARTEGNLVTRINRDDPMHRSHGTPMDTINFPVKTKGQL